MSNSIVRVLLQRLEDQMNELAWKIADTGYEDPAEYQRCVGRFRQMKATRAGYIAILKNENRGRSDIEDAGEFDSIKPTPEIDTQPAQPRRRRAPRSWGGV